MLTTTYTSGVLAREVMESGAQAWPGRTGFRVAAAPPPGKPAP